MKIDEFETELNTTSAKINTVTDILTLVIDYLENDATIDNPISCWDFINRKKEYTELIYIIQDTLKDVVEKQYYLIGELEKNKKNFK